MHLPPDVKFDPLSRTPPSYNNNDSGNNAIFENDSDNTGNKHGKGHAYGHNK